MILFYSDYLEGCHPDILARMVETNLAQTPGYGEDVFCAQAREMIKKVCGTPDADVHFLVGGTQTNATVISSVLRPHQGVLCASTGHINAHETGAIEHGGHKVLPIASTDGKITAAQVRKALEDHRTDSSFEHIVQPGMLYISYPTELGTIYSKDELAAISEACREGGIPLYIDGARLGYGLECDRSDLTIEDIASFADVFYIGGTKQGALFGEAVVICNDALKKDFRYFIKQNGGMLAKGRLLGIQFLTLLEDGLYFKLSRNADVLASKIMDVFKETGHQFLVDSPTNQIFPILDKSEMEILEKEFGFETWQKLDDGRVGVRFCTSWATTGNQVDDLVAAVRNTCK